jgi:c-di-AMP phosphodiesterase-like protein
MGMKSYEVIVLIIVLILVVGVQFYREDKIYQLCRLILMPFLMSFVFYTIYQRNIWNANSILIVGLFISGLTYRAVKFYNKYLKNFKE